MPFPSNFHLNHEVQRPFLYERTDRPYLVSYVGSSNSYLPTATKMRREMLKFCTLHSADCTHSPYNKNGDREPELANGGENAHYKYSLKSVFCLQPIGDLPTRKGLFDAIVFGCIPVVFHPLSASAMYTWHWPTELWKDIAIEIPMNMVDRDKPILFSDPIQHLKDLLEKEPQNVAQRQKLLREHAFELSYSLEFYQTGSGNWPVDEKNRPIRDAYEITMDTLLSLNSGKYSLEPRLFEKSWKEDIKNMVFEKGVRDFNAALKRAEERKKIG